MNTEAAVLLAVRRAEDLAADGVEVGQAIRMSARYFGVGDGEVALRLCAKVIGCCRARELLAAFREADADAAGEAPR